jgi:hypothetical protein
MHKSTEPPFVSPIINHLSFPSHHIRKHHITLPDIVTLIQDICTHTQTWKFSGYLQIHLHRHVFCVWTTYFYWEKSSLDLRSKVCWLQPKPEPLCPGFLPPAKKQNINFNAAIQKSQGNGKKKLGWGPHLEFPNIDLEGLSSNFTNR